MWPQNNLYDAIYSLAFSYLSWNATSTPVVDLGYAKISGIIDPVSSYVNYLGVQYAAAPTGKLRFSAPSTPPFVEGIQIADRQPDRCIPGSTTMSSELFVRLGPRSAVPSRTGVGSFSEDCLYLNVYTPGERASVDELLPVVVYIHGGGYAIGGTTGLFGTAPFDGNDLIRESGDGVVAVVLQYRLGILGFLAGESVKDKGALNAGLLDQQYALQWVQEHIHKFGGDKTKVSIWGQSAGAASSVIQTIANDGRTDPPLFRAAILTSFFLTSFYHYNDPEPEAMFTAAVQYSNCSSSSNALDCLRSAPVETLEAANYYIGASGEFTAFTFKPVIDGVFLTQSPTQAFKEGKFNTKNILAITNSNEGAIFVDAEVEKSLATDNIVKQLYPNMDKAHIDAVVAQYPTKGDYSSVGVSILSEAVFVCPSYHLLRHLPNSGYKGSFTVPPGYHGTEMDYFFPSTNPSGVPPYENSAFRKAFGNSFLDYVINLDPNVKWEETIMPEWYLWDSSLKNDTLETGTTTPTKNEYAEMVFGRTDDMEPSLEMKRSDEGLIERCRFWESIGEQTHH